MNKIVNKGTGAGGFKTTINGNHFEENTNNLKRLSEQGYKKHFLNKKGTNFYLEKKTSNKQIIFLLQNNFKIFMKKEYKINVFRSPDEAYLIKYKNKNILKILEKKEQSVEGSVETKLWAGPSLKREYELVLGPCFQVYYGFCVNNFLELKFKSSKKKYNILGTILDENNIPVLFGENDDYFEKLDSWLNNFL